MNNVIDLAAERRARSGRLRAGGTPVDADLSSSEDHLSVEASTADLAKDHGLHEIATALGLPRDSLL